MKLRRTRRSRAAVSMAAKTLEVRSVAQWRRWLDEHHDSESEIWLIFHKRGTGRASIGYDDAVDEALCFGWIDSLIKRLDGARYARKFTPRKPDSKWSIRNRRRYGQLKASGRLRSAGLRRQPTERGYGAARPFPSKVPAYIERALRSRPEAWRYFAELAPSYRRQYVTWIDWAKRAETKARRLREAIRLLAAGERLGLK
jgi:uncharacterized protein YdeI (YjbR/CyaY-like superfamily)